MDASSFVKSLPVLEDFSLALPMKDYRPVPDDWLVAVTDVVKSREAIKAGRFKPVNMAGVAIISAVMNALGHQDIPYIFGGDGAAIVCSPDERALVKNAMAQCIAWVGDELDLELRGALVPVGELRKLEFDVQVSAVRVSPAIINFAFAGGGVGMAEKLMKKGRFRVQRTGKDDYPDLAGLSCRWTPISEENKKIISVIVEPSDEHDTIPAKVMTTILKKVRGNTADGHPVPKGGPEFVWPTKQINLEARAMRNGRSVFLTKLKLHMETLFAFFLFKTGLKIGDFDPKHYARYTSLNTDYRKIQDGIRMTVCLEKPLVNDLRDYLEAQRNKKIIRFGISEQDEAVLTCYVPSVMSDSHYHFLDGAGGGYAAAADDLA